MRNLETKWKIKFYLEKRKSSDEKKVEDLKVPIYMFVTFGKGQRLQFYTRETVLPDHYDNQYKNKVKTDRSYFRPIKPQATDSKAINGRLEKIAHEAQRLIEFADKSDPPIDLTVEYLRSALKNWMDNDVKVKSRKGLTIAEAMDKYKEYSEQHHAPKTVAGFKQIRDNVEAYINSTKNIDLTLNDIDQDFIDGFEAFLISKRVKLKPLSNNTKAKNLKKFRTFLLWCDNKGWIKYSFRIRYKENEGPIVFITQEELALLENAKFENIKHQYVRDAFIFGIFTGLRYGDLRALRKNDLRDGRIWYYEQKKKLTYQKNIKLAPKALAIAEKYYSLPGDMLLPSYSNPNETLKKVFEIAKIEREVTIAHQYANGTIEKTVIPLSKLAHSHMQRKTFITLALSKGMPEQVIKSFTGHTKDSGSFKRYHEIIDSMKDEAMDTIFGNF